MRCSSQIAVFSLMLFWVPFLPSQTAKTPTSNLENAIHFYKIGDWRKARIYTSIIGVSNKGNSNYKKLKALLFLADQKKDQANLYIAEYLQLKRNPFWAYYLGVIAFDNRQFKKANYYFSKAISDAKKIPYIKLNLNNKLNQKSSWPISLSPVLCNWPAPKSKFVRPALPHPFGNAKQARQLWNKQIAPEEIEFSRYFQYIIAKYYRWSSLYQPDSHEEDEFREIKRKPLRKSELDYRTKRLIDIENRNYLQQKIYLKCLTSLNYQFKEKLTGVRLRPYDKSKINFYVNQVLFLQMLDLQTVNSQIAYVKHLLKEKRAHEALHILRIVLIKQNLFLLKNDTASFKLLYKILDFQEIAYLQLAQKNDALSSQRLASIIKQVARGTMNKLSISKYTKLKQRLLDRADENRYHRESLLLRLANENKASKRKRLKNFLSERDQKQEEIEFSAAFQYLKGTIQ